MNVMTSHQRPLWVLVHNEKGPLALVTRIIFLKKAFKLAFEQVPLPVPLLSSSQKQYTRTCVYRWKLYVQKPLQRLGMERLTMKKSHSVLLNDSG